jgi:signal peptide peptidase SppA
MSVELSNVWGIIPSALDKIKNIDRGQFESLLKQYTPPLDNTYKAEIRSNVAIIPLFGIIVPRDYWYYKASLQLLAHDITTAVNNPSVRAVILNMDSPGGNVVGCVEMTALIRQMKVKKPVIAFAHGSCASACYWIASACTEIIVSPTAEAGSLGVVWDTWDSSVRDQRDGYENIQIVSEISPDKRPDIKTPEGRAKIQAVVDSMANAMISDIALNRGVTVDTVKSSYGKGGLFVGQQIVDQKMAEGVGTLEALIDKYKNYALFNLTNSKGAVMSLPSGENSGPAITAESIQKDHVAVYQAIFSAGKAAGITQECDRIKKIEAAAVPGYEKVISGMKFDSSKTDADVALAIIQTQKQNVEALKLGKASETDELNKQLNGLGGTSNPGQDKSAADKAIIAEAAKNVNQRRR